MTQHIGIFLCTCDGRIQEKVQVDAFPYVMRANKNIALVQAMPHVCLPDGIRSLQNAIRAHHLDRVVVAACPARFQEKNLRDKCADAGVNPNDFTLVDWREGCVGAHHDSKQAITGKAIDLVQMGVARVSNADAIQPMVTKIIPRVLVIGGGVVGMTAARGLADRGIAVTLVEREAELGGQFARVIASEAKQPLTPSTEIASSQNTLLAMTPLAAYHETLTAVRTHPNIQVQLNSQIIGVNGSVGNYLITIGNTKISYVARLNVGAVVVATGAQEFSDATLYRYDGKRVLTLNEFEGEMANDPSLLTAHCSLAYLLCAGSRDEHFPYCSNVCCLNALTQALRVKQTQPEAQITILYRDLYLGDEEIVRDARRAGIEFVRYGLAQPPRVSKDSVEVGEKRIAYDRLILATPLVPHQDAGVLSRHLKLSRDSDGFFLEPHQRLRPEEQVERGIFVCGSAHRPVDMETAILQGMTTAARASRFVQQGEFKRSGACAWVDWQLCTGCAQCVESCAFSAISLTTNNNGGDSVRSVIDPCLCVACGNCAVTCPSKAIDLPASCDAQIIAQIEGALAANQKDKLALVFACRWSGYAAMELAGARGMIYPTNVRVIELPCSARLDPLHVLCAFNNGADRVMLALCPPNECHFSNGNAYAESRMENLRAQLAAHGVDPERLQIAPMMGDDAGAWVRAITRAEGNHVSRISFIRPEMMMSVGK